MENPVVKLCAEGMQAESEGHPNRAYALFRRAWAAAGDTYERCIAAHYVARHQPSAADRLAWNLRALAEADGVGDERIGDFRPSLLLNVGHSLEVTGDVTGARAHYFRAAELAAGLPEGRYGDIVRSGIASGLERVGPAEPDACPPS